MAILGQRNNATSANVMLCGAAYLGATFIQKLACDDKLSVFICLIPAATSNYIAAIQYS